MLKPCLKTMGLNPMGDDQADLVNITAWPIRVSEDLLKNARVGEGTGDVSYGE